MAVASAVLALSVPIGGVCELDRARSGEEMNRGAHRGKVSGMDRDDDGGGSLALPGLCVGVEVPGKAIGGFFFLFFSFFFLFFFKSSVRC